ncbi:MAG: adenylate/guanylate cyclase domain-containing protein [Alphaproteobacteria bacterium]|nr:adenylate/guanylate cyclase domain-containing protein [Alphaproteobacteria bacterium]
MKEISDRYPDGNAVLALSDAALDALIEDFVRRRAGGDGLSLPKYLSRDELDTLYGVSLALPADRVQEIRLRMAAAYQRLLSSSRIVLAPDQPHDVVTIGPETKAGAALAPASLRAWAGGDRVILAIVYTDMVGATRLGLARRDRRMLELKQRHFARSDGLIAANGGRRVKTMGDGVMAVFRSVDAAFDYACALHADPGSPDLEIRAGIHTGPVEITEDNDIHGRNADYGGRVIHAIPGPEIWLSDRAKEDLETAGRHDEALAAYRADIHQLKDFPNATLWRPGIATDDPVPEPQPAVIPNAGTTAALLTQIAGAGGAPDWTIHDLFYYLRPTIKADGPTSEWDEVGDDVLDKLSTGQLPAWGREIVRGSTLSFRSLAPIDPAYWRAARFTFVFLLEGRERDRHASQDGPSRLPDLGDLRVSRAAALALWPHPLRQRWNVGSFELIARYHNAPTQEVAIPCASLSLFDAQVETHHDGYGNPQYRQVIAPAHIVAAGTDAAHVRGLGFEPQLLSFIDPATSTERLFVLQGVDAYAAAGHVTFMVESPEAISIKRVRPEQIEQARACFGERLNLLPIGIDLPTVLRHGPRLILHVMPASAFEGHRLDSKAPKLLGHHFRPDGYDGIDGRSRLEGWTWFQPPQEEPGLPNRVSQWCSRLDLNGFVEIVLTLDDLEGGGTVLRGFPLERCIVKTLDAVADGYAALKLESPVVVRVTLFNVLGMKLMKSTAGRSAGFDRAVVTTQELELPDMKKPLGRLLKPLLDTLWHAAGWGDGSPSYGQGGDWDGYGRRSSYRYE